MRLLFAQRGLYQLPLKARLIILPPSVSESIGPNPCKPFAISDGLRSLGDAYLGSFFTQASIVNRGPLTVGSTQSTNSLCESMLTSNRYASSIARGFRDHPLYRRRLAFLRRRAYVSEHEAAIRTMIGIRLGFRYGEKNSRSTIAPAKPPHSDCHPL